MLAGNSGVGKTFIIDNFNLLSDHIQVVQKKTTRPARSRESKDQTIELIFNKKESDVRKMDFCYEYRGNFYGFNRSDIDKIIARGLSPLLVVRRVECIRKLKIIYEKTFTVLVKAENKDVIPEKLNMSGCPFEVQQRLDMRYELELEREYEENRAIFDCIVYNSYTNKFILEMGSILNSR
jgi:guanylate kinase